MSKEKKKDKGEEKVKKAEKVEKTAPEKKAKAAKPAKAAAAPKAKVTKPKIVISNDDIALRAYFIAEKRNQHGHHGDSHSDWIEAERQLREEAKKAVKKA